MNKRIRTVVKALEEQINIKNNEIKILSAEINKLMMDDKDNKNS